MLALSKYSTQIHIINDERIKKYLQEPRNSLRDWFLLLFLWVSQERRAGSRCWATCPKYQHLCVLFGVTHRRLTLNISFGVPMHSFSHPQLYFQPISTFKAEQGCSPYMASSTASVKNTVLDWKDHSFDPAEHFFCSYRIRKKQVLVQGI